MPVKQSCYLHIALTAVLRWQKRDPVLATGSAAWAVCGPSLVQTSENVCFGPWLDAGCENIAFSPSLVLQGCCIISGFSLVIDVRVANLPLWLRWYSAVRVVVERGKSVLVSICHSYIIRVP